MTLLTLIKQESPRVRRRLMVAAALAGLSNASIMGAVSAASQDPGHLSTRHFVLFALSVVLFVFSSRHTFHQTAKTIEKALYDTKLRIVDKIRSAEAERIEQLGMNEIYDRLTENVTIISSSVNVIAYTMESLLVVVFAGFYVASVSPTALIVLLVINGLWAALYYAKHAQVKGYLQQAAQSRLGFLESLMDLLRGFKQVKLSRSRGEEVRSDIDQIADDLRNNAVKAHGVFSDNLLIGNSNLFLLLGGITFVLPQYDAASSSAVPRIIGAVLFTWGSLQSVISGIPNFMRANMAMANIHALESKLDESIDDGPEAEAGAEAESDPWQGRFGTLEVQDLKFSYQTEDESFHIGPISLSITAGETVFIVGGNGSGKSTLLKVLTGLYWPNAGSIRLDGIPIRPSNVQAYRELVSTVLTDFHLFKKLYGASSREPARVRELLEQMNLAHKTSYADGHFTKLDLSTGQRKRMALIVSLLEDRPLYAFDELAADQDPEFRRYFYEELLPALQQRGKTVIVISHDDRYFRCADRIVTMEYGQVRSITPGRGPVVS